MEQSSPNRLSVDLLYALIDRRRVILVCSLIGLLVGVAAALTVPAKYKYGSIIEISSHLYYRSWELGEMRVLERSTDYRVYVEQPKSLYFRMRNKTVPEVVVSLGGEVAGSDVVISFKSDSDLLGLESVGTAAEEEKIRRFHDALISAVRKEHTVLSNNKKLAIENDADDLRAQLSKSETRRSRIVARVEAVEAHIEQNGLRLPVSAARNGDESINPLLAELALDGLRHSLENIDSVQSLIMQHINDAEYQLQSFTETTGSDLIRSPKPVGLRPSLMIFIGFALGILIGTNVAVAQEISARYAARRSS